MKYHGLQASERNGSRELAPDVIRAIAMAMVVTAHLHPLFLSAHPLVHAPFALLGTLGVPLFVMLTGFLLLGRDYADGERL